MCLPRTMRGDTAVYGPDRSSAVAVAVDWGITTQYSKDLRSGCRSMLHQPVVREELAQCEDGREWGKGKGKGNDGKRDSAGFCGFV